MIFNQFQVCFTGIRIVGTAIRYVFGCYEERVSTWNISNIYMFSTITFATHKLKIWKLLPGNKSRNLISPAINTQELSCRFVMLDNNNKNSTVNHNGKRVIHGDQGTPICDACCKGDKCNSKDCFDLKQSKIVLLFFNIIISYTLFIKIS